MTDVNFRVQDNADWRETRVLKVDGAPRDLTGTALHMALVDRYNQTVLTLSTVSGTLVLDADPATGSFEIAVPRTTLEGLDPGVYCHDLLLVKDGETELIWRGRLDLIRGQTRLS